MPRRLKLSRALAAVAATALVAGAATTLAEVTVYDNDMSSQGDFNEILRSGGGKRCDKKYREKTKVMHASVKKSPTTCSFRPPVQGDDELPNHSFAVDGKILKSTPKSMRGGRLHRAHRPRRRQQHRLLAADLPRSPALRALPRARRAAASRPRVRTARSRRSTSATGSS